MTMRFIVRMSLAGPAILFALGTASCNRVPGSSFEIERETQEHYVSVVDEDQQQIRTPLENGLFRSEFFLPRSWLSSASGTPFESEVTFVSPQSHLENHGIVFEGEARADRIPGTDFVGIEQTADQLDLAEAYFDSAMITFVEALYIEVEVYQAGSGAARSVLESAETERDHGPEREALRRETLRGDVRLTASAGIRAESGQVATLKRQGEAVSEPSLLGISKFEARPQLAGDGRSIRMQYRVSFAGARDGGEKAVGEYSLESIGFFAAGDWLIAGHVPVPNSDKLRLVFLRATIQKTSNTSGYWINEPTPAMNVR